MPEDQQLQDMIDFKARWNTYGQEVENWIADYPNRVSENPTKPLPPKPPGFTTWAPPDNE